MEQNDMMARAFDRAVSYYPYIARRAKDHFVYTVEYNTLGVSAQQSEQQFTVENSSDFIVLALAYTYATAAAGTTEQTYPLPLVQIRDSGSGANWFSGNQPLGNVAGRGSQADSAGPMILPHPRWVQAGSQVTVQATNLEATARRLWIGFIGCKVYRGLRPMPGQAET